MKYAISGITASRLKKILQSKPYWDNNGGLPPKDQAYLEWQAYVRKNPFAIQALE